MKRIQNLRKESGLEITDRIRIEMTHEEAIEGAVADFQDYICGQVLADSLTFVTTVAGENPQALELDGHNVQFTIQKQ